MHCARAVVSLAVGLGITVAALVAQDEPIESPGMSPVVFFPPIPPVYGAPVSNRIENGALIFQGRRLLPPDGMADFVGEWFFPPLSTRLYGGVLSAKLEGRLEAYRSARQREVNALLDVFVTQHHGTAAARLEALQSLAEVQTPRLVALEAVAEQLRRDLGADFLLNRIDWNAGRRWKLGEIPRTNPAIDAEALFQVVRASASYHDGWIAEQRGLLEELAYELRLSARRARGVPAALAESDAMFFSPAMTRLRLPPQASPELRERFGAYNGLKAELKRELREAVIAQEKSGERRRTEAFAALAERQWPQFGLLEQIAGEIRALLGTQFEVPPPPAPPWIPSGLFDSVRSYNEDRDSYFGEMRLRIDRAAEALARAEQVDDPDDRARRQQEFSARLAEVRKQAARSFQDEHAERFAELEGRYRAIRDALTLIAERQTDPATGRPLDAETLLRRHGISMQEFDRFGRETAIYANYRLAMLQPGLSAPQRRLLFRYAFSALAQPLPFGEFLPRRAGLRPLPVP